MAEESHETISKNSMPRWYQDLSIPQMEKVFSLGNIIRDDYAEKVTGRTQRALGDIGVTSTFLKISPQQIKKLRRSTDLDPVKFLLEIYRIVTGKYFTDEEYKKHYDCNERIILSAIAFLLLPEIVMELHDRLPMGLAPKLPPKPVPRIVAPRKNENSSFLGPNAATPDLVTYKKELFFWRKKCAELPKPRVILPPFVPYSEKKNGTVGRNVEDDVKVVERDEDSPDSYQRETIDKEQNNELENAINKSEEPRDIVDEAPEAPESSHEQKISLESPKDPKIHDEIRKSSKMSRKKSHSGQPRLSSISGPKNKGRTESKAKDELSGESAASEDPKNHSAPRKSTKVHGNIKKKDSMHTKRKSKLRRSKLAIEQRDESEDKNPETNKPPDDLTQGYFEKKPPHDGKEAHLIVTGISETEDSSQFPMTQETGGIAYVTPENSDEDFFQALKYESKKSYPRGRENLSRNWQEWFRDVEEEFFEVEKEADKILKSVKNTLKLMGPETSCDPCCSCRQTRKANVKFHKTKTPQMVIESVVIDGENDKYVVGSLVMNSPAPSPSESTENLAQFVPSFERIIKNKIISGVTNEKGEMNYYVSGVSKEIEHVPRKIISQRSLEKRVKNVPPCGCAIEKMINEGILEITSDDNIPWSKRDEICMGRKYRPEETGAGSCRDYPNDKTCRRNPFKKKIDEQIRAKLREKDNFGKNAYPEGEKKMYSLADFQPCGDEDGMAVCGGPWGAVNIPDEEELARREAEAKRILESPPCGDKPGRAICGAPFGSRHPIPKKPKKEEDDEDEEEEDEDEEEKKKSRVRAPRQRVAELKMEKHLNRGPGCSAVTDKKDNVLEPLDTSPGRGINKKENSRLARKAARLDKKKKSLAGQEETKNLESNSKSSLLEATENLEPSGSRNRDEEKRRSDAMKRLKKEWKRSIIMANKLIVSPVVLPDEQAKKCQRETQNSGCCGSKKIFSDPKPQDSRSPGEGPFGWRTESERALPAEKTLTYLVKPQDPMDRIAVRPGGKPCECRENRNAKKVLLYNVNGISKDGKSKRDEKLSRVIDGLIYITPEPSVRNSEEYIPEYELYDSPYDKCTRDRKNEDFKYIEKYLGPASLMKKQQKGPKPCGCSVVLENADSPRLEPGANDLEKTENPEKVRGSREKPQDSKIPAKPEEPKKTSKLHSMKWSKACEDEGLVQFYARCRDNVPCWLRCVEFTKYGCCTMPKRLQVKRPVCECKYERKIVRREEEKKKWLSRQERLKSCKKQAFGRVEGISRPMRTETNLIVSDVKRIPGEETTAELRYCIDGVAQDYVMSPGEFLLSGIGMHTPVTTPDPSESRLRTNSSIPEPPRHFPSPTISASRAVSGAATETLQLRPSSDVNRAEKFSDASKTKVDVLFQNGKSEDPTESIKLDGPADTERKMSRSSKKRKSANNRPKKDDLEAETKDKNGSEQIENPRHRKNTKSSRSSNARDPDHRKSQNQARRSENKDHEVERKSRNEARASKDEDRGNERQSKQEARRSKGKSVEFEKKDSKDPAEMQNSHRKTVRASNIELRKSIAKNDDAHDTKESVHVTKSTGNISPQPDKTPDHESKKLPPGGDLKQMMQNELRKMAEEGYLFAKLPACHLMPQLQYWIMYRKGFPSCFSMEEKKKLMDRSLKLWESIQKPKPMKAPALGSSKKGTKTANSDESALMKREAELKTAQFYSQLRKARVLRSRTMWSLMEFGKFPGISFKRAFFTYQPSKESDGFVFRPWTNSDETEGSEAAD